MHNFYIFSLSVLVKVYSTSSCRDMTENTADEIWFWAVSGVERHMLRKLRRVFSDCSCARMVLDTSNGGAAVNRLLARLQPLQGIWQRFCFGVCTCFCVFVWHSFSLSFCLQFLFFWNAKRTSWCASHSPATAYMGKCKLHCVWNAATYAWSHLDIALEFFFGTMLCTQCSSTGHVYRCPRHCKTKLRQRKSRWQSAKIYPFPRTHICIFDIAKCTETAKTTTKIWGGEAINL